MPDRPIDENDLPDEAIFAMWEEAEPVTLVDPVVEVLEAWKDLGVSEPRAEIHLGDPNQQIAWITPIRDTPSSAGSPPTDTDDERDGQNAVVAI